MRKIILYAAIYVPLVALMSAVGSLIGVFVTLEPIVWMWDWTPEGRGWLLFITAVIVAIEMEISSE